MAPPGQKNFLHAWLGDPGILGAGSWLEVIYFTAGVIVAIIAIIQLRKSAAQSRATFLLSLTDKWHSLASARTEAFKMHNEVRQIVFDKYSGKSDAEQLRKLRVSYKDYLDKLKKDRDPQFSELVEYWTFFEIIGLMVRKRYLPFRDVYLLYKESLIEIEMACPAFIEEWQRDAHKPHGLLENMLRVANRARRRHRIEEALASLKFWGAD